MNIGWQPPTNAKTGNHKRQGAGEVSTPKQKIGLSAAEWRARYAEIAPLYAGGEIRPAKTIDWNRVRQWDEFGHALKSDNPRANIKLPSDPRFAVRALTAAVEGLG